MATNEERRAATRAKLIKAARENFARSGFDGTHTGDILDQAGMSRGALYHHFKSKRDLFEAVYISVSSEAIDHAAKSGVSGESPLENLISACLGWLRVVRRPEVASILLDQGPQVLGWKKARLLEAESSLGLMMASLEQAVEAGQLDVLSVELTARLINALLAEAALASLHSEPAISAAKQEAAVRQLIEGLQS